MGDIVENLTEVKAENTNCSSLVYQVSQFIMEGYQVSQDDLVNPC